MDLVSSVLIDQVVSFYISSSLLELIHLHPLEELEEMKKELLLRVEQLLVHPHIPYKERLKDDHLPYRLKEEEPLAMWNNDYEAPVEDRREEELNPLKEEWRMEGKGRGREEETRQR